MSSPITDVDSGPRLPAPPQPSVVAESLAMALGGALGASLRYAVSVAVLAAGQHRLFATLVANALGAGLLGVLISRLEAAAEEDARRGQPHRLQHLIRPFLVVGVLGSFTTFSALTLEHRSLAQDGGELAAFAHLGGSLAIGVGAYLLGARLAAGRR